MESKVEEKLTKQETPEVKDVKTAEPIDDLVDGQKDEKHKILNSIRGGRRFRIYSGIGVAALVAIVGGRAILGVDPNSPILSLPTATPRAGLIHRDLEVNKIESLHMGEVDVDLLFVPQDIINKLNLLLDQGLIDANFVAGLFKLQGDYIWDLANMGDPTAISNKMKQIDEVNELLRSRASTLMTQYGLTES